MSDMREQIAKIIDPQAFFDLEVERQWCDAHGKDLRTWGVGLLRSCDTARVKADKILALSPVGEERGAK